MLPFCGAVSNVNEVPSCDATSDVVRCRIPFRYTYNLSTTNVFDGEKVLVVPSTDEERSSCNRGIGADEYTVE
jgi:hypothetical protein